MAKYDHKPIYSCIERMMIYILLEVIHHTNKYDVRLNHLKRRRDAPA